MWRAFRRNTRSAMAGHARPFAMNPIEANCAAPPKANRLKAIASIGEKLPLVRAVSPYTNPKPAALTRMPSPSRTSLRRDSPSSSWVVAPITDSAQEGLRAGPVADDEHGVLVERVPGDVEQAGAA